MCEFDVFLNGEKIFEEAVYLERDSEDGSVSARDILGNEKDLGKVEIEELDVSSEKMILAER